MGGPRGGILHRVAEPHRPTRGNSVRRLRVRDVPRPHAEHVSVLVRRGRLLSDPRLPHLPSSWRTRRDAEHLQRTSAGGHEQHLRVVARGSVLPLSSRSSFIVPDNSPEPRLRLHRALQQLGLSQRGVQQLACTGSWWFRSGSCSPSTRSPATTPRPTCPRRPQEAVEGAAKGMWRSIFYSRHRRLRHPPRLPVRDSGRAAGTRVNAGRFRRGRRHLHLRAARVGLAAS